MNPIPIPLFVNHYPIQRLWPDYFIVYSNGSIIGLGPYNVVSQFNLMMKAYNLVLSPKQLKVAFSNSKSKYCRNETIRYNRLTDEQRKTKSHLIMDNIYDLAVKDYPHAIFEMLKLYDFHGPDGNLDIGLGRQRMITNGFEENNKLNYRGLAGRYGNGVYNIQHPHTLAVRNIGDKRTAYGLESGDNILYFKYEIEEKSIFDICATFDDILFLLTSKVVIIKHLVLVDEVLGYILEAPHYFDQGPILKKAKL